MEVRNSAPNPVFIPINIYDNLFLMNGNALILV